MKLTLRNRIVLTLVPWLALLAVVGGAAIVLLHRLGGSIDAILRENYDSVIYMERLKESLERIDSSFTFALAGREHQARRQYQQQWPKFLKSLREEQNNITIPGEGDLVAKLSQLTERYRQQGDLFYNRPTLAAAGAVGSLAMPSGSGTLAAAAEEASTWPAARHEDYFGRNGLLETFQQISVTAESILKMNQDNMEHASRDARRIATQSLFGLWIGLAAVALLGSLLAWRTVQDILRPIRAVTDSAQSIGEGNLDQIVPVQSNDELGQLAGAFNVMARQLRGYRQSHKAELIRAQQTSQATINAFPHAVLVVNQLGQVTLANPAARRLFGVLPHGDDLKAGAWQPPEALRTPLSDALRHQRDHLPTGFDQTIVLRVDGQDCTYLPRVLVIRDSEERTLGAAVLLEDVTRFRLLDQVKNNLVATVSHELKTPLTAIRLAVHLLLEETVGPLTSKQVELLVDARDNTERLVDMIDNLLNLARLETGVRQLEVRSVDPADVVREAADAMRPRAEDKGVNLIVEIAPDLPAIAADAKEIAHALHNLLDNSLRYTPAGGNIRITAAANSGQVAIVVADMGAGIPPEYLPHVFERFFRVPGQSHDGGTGLGLAIVREIVTAHGGNVACESRVREGTTVTMRLPSAPKT